MLVDAGGAVEFRELLYQLRRRHQLEPSSAELVDALYDLEQAGKVTPTHWTATR